MHTESHFSSYRVTVSENSTWFNTPSPSSSGQQVPQNHIANSPQRPTSVPPLEEIFERIRSGRDLDDYIFPEGNITFWDF